jgi:2-polyprenyl-3-methyl-5-hydroxy-6-metoxy-1,4-benzoquinol methylase
MTKMGDQRRNSAMRMAILPDMEKTEESVARYYDTAIFEAELVRLTRDSPAERGITLRWLERLVPNAVEVAEIGVGGGLYSECLARKGCRLHLVDVSARLLETAAERLRAAGLGAAIAGASHESATGLASLATGAFDAVLLLGPLYHLCSADSRRQAVAEAARILKPGGWLFAAGINRLSYLRDLLRESPEQACRRRAFHQQYLRDGNLDPKHAPPIGFAHLTTIADFRALFANSFDEAALVGVESFSTAWQTRLNDLPLEEVEAWLDLIETTGQSPEGLGRSDHFLYIGRHSCHREASVENR